MPVASKSKGMPLPRLTGWVRANAALVAIVGLGIVLRAYRLTSIPPALFCDEADIANNALSLWQTGRDLHGVRLPVFFQALGDYKNPVAIYSAIPTIALLGLTELAVRLVPLVYGSLTILAVYALARELFDDTVGRWAALFVAISPWSIHLSRIGMEFAPSVFWVTLALWLLLRSLRDFRFYPYALASLILGLMSYYTPWIYLPVLAAAFLLIYRDEVRRWARTKAFWLATGLSLLALAALIGPYLWDGRYLTRWRSVRADGISFGNAVAGYFNHFSAAFLFTRGDSGFPGARILRHSVPGMGELYGIQLPLLAIGAISVWWQPARWRSYLFLAALLVVYPLGSALVQRNPFATRSCIGIVPLSILTGLGARWGLRSGGPLWLSRAARGAFGAILLASLASYLSLLDRYPAVSSGFWGWQYGMRPGLERLKAHEAEYDDLYMTGQYNAPEASFRFYNHAIGCRKCAIGGPIVPGRRQLFAFRPYDVRREQVVHPDHVFRPMETIVAPGGTEVVMLIGTFEPRVNRERAGGKR